MSKEHHFTVKEKIIFANYVKKMILKGKSIEYANKQAMRLIMHNRIKRKGKIRH